MAHRIDLKVGQGTTYQLQTTGTEPITCAVTPAMPGATVNEATKVLTITPEFTATTGKKTIVVFCRNCSNGQGGTLYGSTLSIDVHVTADLNCEPIAPPSPALQQFVYNTAPVKVPTNFVGIHATTMAESGGNLPAPNFTYDFIRSHDGVTSAVKPADAPWVDAGMMWRALERSPGVYDFDLARKWANAYPGKPIMWTLFGTPDFYAKYQDSHAQAFRDRGYNGPLLYPGSGHFSSPPSDPQRIVDFARALANDPVLGPRIFAFELWNEAMLPWEANYSRWNADWGVRAKNNNWVQQPQPWYSGTADEMATMARMLKQANLGKPLMACGFVDAHGGVAGQYAFDRMLNGTAAGGGQMKDFLDAVSVHWYDYTGENLNGFVRDMVNYRSRLDALGKPNLPMWNTETGDFVGTMSPTQVQRLILVAAATQLQSLVLYRYADNDSGHHMGDPVTNQATQQGITAARNAVSGKTICEAAVLQGGQVWVHTSDGLTFRA